MNGFSTKLGNGRYRVRWRDPAGRNRSRTFDTRADGQRFLSVVRHATAFNIPLATPEGFARDTLRDIADQWWERKRSSIRPRTAVVYGTALRHLPDLMLGTELRSIKPRDVESLLASLPVPTARKVRTVLYQMFNDAVRYELCERNPVLNARVLNGALDVPHVEGRKVSTPLRPETLPSLEDVERIALHVPERYRALVLVAAFAGLRLGEASGMRPSDIDMESKTIRIERQWSQVEKALTEPKTRAGNRTVVFADRIAEPLTRHVERFGTEAFVFTNLRGSPVHPTNFRTRIWQPSATLAGFPGMHYHDLRHIYASTLIAGGVNLALVARLMGHSNPQVTLTVYSHFFETDYSKAHEAFGRVRN